MDSTASIESIVGKVSTSASESISISDITDKIPQIPDAVALTPAAVADAAAQSVPTSISSVPDIVTPAAVSAPDVSAVSSAVRLRDQSLKICASYNVPQ